MASGFCPNISSAWWGSSTSAGYRPRPLGPRPLTGLGSVAPAPGVGSSLGVWPTALPAGGRRNLFQPWGVSGFRGLGYADGAPGWTTPFDPIFKAWTPTGSPLSALGKVLSSLGSLFGLGSETSTDSSGQSAYERLPVAHPLPPGTVQSSPIEPAPYMPISHTLEPLVNPHWVFDVAKNGSVRYNNSPIFVYEAEIAQNSKWPLYPNRGSVVGPYGSHALPYYAFATRTSRRSAPGWPFLRATTTGIVGAHIRDISRFRLPSPSYVDAQRRYMVPGVRQQPGNYYPDAQAIVRSGGWDYTQNRQKEKVVHRPWL